MSGYFTPGLPAATLPFTGLETLGADTNATSGVYPETEAITLAQLSAIGQGPLIVATTGSTVTLDARSGSHFKVTLTATGSTLTISSASPGQEVEVELVQDATGSRTITTYTNGTWPTNGTTPTLTTTAAAVDVIKGTWNESAGKWRFATKGLNYA